MNYTCTPSVQPASWEDKKSLTSGQLTTHLSMSHGMGKARQRSAMSAVAIDQATKHRPTLQANPSTYNVVRGTVRAGKLYLVATEVALGRWAIVEGMGCRRGNCIPLG